MFQNFRHAVLYQINILQNMLCRLDTVHKKQKLYMPFLKNFIVDIFAY